MKNQKEDRRVQRTKQSIEHALIELTVKKGYDKVSVQDIVDFANVGRATFYAHYEDKDDLFTQSIERFFDMISHEITLKNTDKTELLPVLAIFDHMEGHAHIHRAFGASPLLHKKFHHHFVILIRRRLETLGHDNIPIDIMANYLAGALLSLVEWWLNGKTPYSAQEMAQMYQQMVKKLLR
jgi:AcrR family transcriptional regulator